MSKTERTAFLGDGSVQLDLWIYNGYTAQTGIDTSASAVTVQLRHKDTGNLFDFSDNRFKAAGWTSATQVLTEVSAVSAGLYRTTFSSTVDNSINNGTTVVAEYRDNGGRRITEDIVFIRPPAGAQDIANSQFGNIVLKGQFTAEDRKRLFDMLEQIQSDVEISKVLSDEIVGRINAIMVTISKEEVPNQDLIDQFEELKLSLKSYESKFLKYMIKILPLQDLEERIRDKKYGP